MQETIVTTKVKRSLATALSTSSASTPPRTATDWRECHKTCVTTSFLCRHPTTPHVATAAAEEERDGAVDADEDVEDVSRVEHDGLGRLERQLLPRKQLKLYDQEKLVAATVIALTW